MLNSILEIVGQIKLLRLNLLPPYCENLDEDERSAEDYLAFFSSRFEQSRSSADRYSASLESLLDAQDRDRTEDESLLELFAARAEFVASFPFCSDELIGVSGEELQAQTDFMVKIYKRKGRILELRRLIAQYTALLEKLEVLLAKSS